MLYFNNDYNMTCHPQVLKALEGKMATMLPGYGVDECCTGAADLIRKACKKDEIAVHFLVGGTQANLVLIAAALRPHQAVIGAGSAHINVHETGSIEAVGHKIVTAASTDGKITAEQVRQLHQAQATSSEAEHIAQPKMVYISNPTEYGTTYRLDELEAISAYCRNNGLYLYMDGARLGYALGASDNDITLADYARLCDAFYIGGTKVGAMFGEAMVIADPAIAEDFRYMIKQRGAMLAKGWLLGVQFQALFTDDLYTNIGKHANSLADQIRQTLAELNIPLFLEGTTNQVFVIMPNAALERLKDRFTYAVWEGYDADHTVVRFCTSWATKAEDVKTLCDALRDAVK